MTEPENTGGSRQPATGRAAGLWKQWGDIIITAVVTIAVVLVVTTFLYQPVRVEGKSMYPTLADGSLGMAGIIDRRQGINRFDIVVIDLPSSDEKLVKRVIGLPGETISFADDVLYVDGVAKDQPFLDEDYVSAQRATQADGLFTKDFTVTLGPGEYFCMGDNRLHSSDSRYYGPFTAETIKQVHIYIWWPIDRFGKAG